MEVEEFIKTRAKEIGFSSCGITSTMPLIEEESHLLQWLENGYNADMAYMERNIDKRINPYMLVEGARSIIVLSHNYYPQKELSSNSKFSIANFAYGEDYHNVLKDKMRLLAIDIEQFIQTPFIYRPFVDSAPVLERALAVRSGLGWIGKNSHLIQKGRGSFFFISTIFTSLELNPDPPFTTSHCGKCQACINSCPKQAIMPNKTIDSNKCISYLTIEVKDNCNTDNNNHQSANGSLQRNPSNYIFGCDLCQQACPHNRFATPHNESCFNPSKAMQQFLKNSDWESITAEEFDKIAHKSPLKRAKYSGILRNITATKKQ